MTKKDKIKLEIMNLLEFGCEIDIDKTIDNILMICNVETDIEQQHKILVEHCCKYLHGNLNDPFGPFHELWTGGDD